MLIPEGVAGVYEDVIAIPVRDGSSINAKRFSPESSHSEGSPLVIMMHGGGFVIGDMDGEIPNCRSFALQLGCVCFSVDYRMAPEHPFPGSVNDCWDAVKWVSGFLSLLLSSTMVRTLLIW